MSTLSDLKMQIMLNPKVAFFASLMLNLDIIESDIPTACTDGKYIKFNVPWLNSLSKSQREFVMLHELCHIIYKHALRIKDRDPSKWNTATDYAINAYLVYTCRYPSIDGCLLNKAYIGMSAEEIYTLLPDEPNEDGFIGNDLEPSEADDDIEQYVDDILVQAISSTKAGTAPADIERYIHELLNPKLPWDVLLDKYISEKVKEDYSYTRRNRRYTDIVVPSLYSEQIGLISVYIDASCSVSQEELNQYIAEIVSIKDKLNPTILEVISFDTQIYDVQTILTGEPCNIKLVGGGGTCLTEVAERINSNESEINILFTDGYYSPVEYAKEVLHIIVGNKDYVNEDQPVIHVEI